MLNSKHILIVDMEDRFINAVGRYLEHENFIVHIAQDAYTAQALVKQMRIHIALVSVSLLNTRDSKDWSGIQLAINLSPYTRVIMTAQQPTFEMVRQALAPRINGAAPAYEFVRKEEGIAPLLTTIHKVMNISVEATVTQVQRTASTVPTQKTSYPVPQHPRSSNRFALDMNTRVAIVDDEDIALTDREYRILSYFMDHAETVITREDIVDKILNEVYDEVADCNRVNNIISRLRRKIEPDVNHPQFIVTRWGSGWMFYPEGNAPQIF